MCWSNDRVLGRSEGTEDWEIPAKNCESESEVSELESLEIYESPSLFPLTVTILLFIEFADHARLAFFPFLFSAFYPRENEEDINL